MDSPSSMGEQLLEKVYKIIEDNLENENFTVEELASQVGLSRSMLHRKLVKLTKKSASDLITEKKLALAMELLENDAATASEIAYKLGFSSPSYFNKVFKNHFQISPGEVRKGALIEEPISHIVAIKKNKKPIQKKYIWYLVSLVFILAIIIVGTSIYHALPKSKPIDKSIAILPFDNLSTIQENQYFADGIVEELLNKLSTFKDLKVISRTSSEMFRDKGNKTVPEIAQLLNVNYILEGSVQRLDENVRINIQLIDAKNDNHILSKQYDKKLDEVFQLQSEIAGQIASELSLVINDNEVKSLNQASTKNLQAFEYYQMGRFYSSKRWIDGYEKGNEFYEKAIAEDSLYGLAYAGLADNYHLMSIQGWINTKEGKKKAITLAKKALEIDPHLAGPHAVLGDFYVIDWEWQKGENEYKTAIKLDPNYSTAHQYYAELLSIFGRNDEARTQINKAVELDPFSFVIRFISAVLYFNQEQFDKAYDEIEICLDLKKDHVWAISLAYDIYIFTGRESNALEIDKKYAGQEGNLSADEMDSIFNNEGIYGLTRWHLNHDKYEPDYSSAIFWAMLQDKDKTLYFLEKALDEHHMSLSIYGLQSLWYKFLRPEPRFQALREKMGLSPLPTNQ